MLLPARYFDWVVESVLELEPEDGWAEELEPEDGWAEDEELLDGEDESLLEPDVLPAPAAPLGVEELLELDGEELDAPPLALSFFCTSIEVDEELEPEPDGVALDDGEDVVPEAELEDEPGVVVAPEPDGVVADEELEPAGPRAAPLSDLLQPAIMAPPKARETARARVESFMWPPWLGYGKEAARIGPRALRSHPRCLVFHRGRGARGLRPGAVAIALEVAMLIGVLRVDLPLLGIGPFTSRGGCRADRR